MKGKIKFYLKDKGYGFIICEGKKEGDPDIFFHWSGLDCSEEKRMNIKDNEEVEFDLKEDTKSNKKMAVNIKFLE